jgi:hypothetical protein
MVKENRMDKYILAKYILLITDFLNGRIPVEKFEEFYLRMVKDENYLFAEDIAKIIETLFSDVDAYCGNPEIANYDLSDPFHDIDEIELLKRSKIALEQLER